jgi:hypothetical protein
LRKEFVEYAEANKGLMQTNHVYNGCFWTKGHYRHVLLRVQVLFGFVGVFDFKRNEAYVWGNGKPKVNFLTYQDTAEYTAEVALDDLATILQVRIIIKGGTGGCGYGHMYTYHNRRADSLQRRPSTSTMPPMRPTKKMYPSRLWALWKRWMP